MKRIITILLFNTIFINILLAQIPDMTGIINDYADLIPDSYEISLSNEIRNIEIQTGINIYILSVSTIEPYESIEEYSYDIYNKLNSDNKEMNNAIIFTVSQKERSIRIDVCEALKNKFSDDFAGQILDMAVIPYLKNGNYGKGFLKGVEQLRYKLDDEYAGTKINKIKTEIIGNWKTQIIIPYYTVFEGLSDGIFSEYLENQLDEPLKTELFKTYAELKYISAINFFKNQLLQIKYINSNNFEDFIYLDSRNENGMIKIVSLRDNTQYWLDYKFINDNRILIRLYMDEYEANNGYFFIAEGK